MGGRATENASEDRPARRARRHGTRPASAARELDETRTDRVRDVRSLSSSASTARLALLLVSPRSADLPPCPRRRSLERAPGLHALRGPGGEVPHEAPASTTQHGAGGAARRARRARRRRRATPLHDRGGRDLPPLPDVVGNPHRRAARVPSTVRQRPARHAPLHPERVAALCRSEGLW
jgi:hypothetical protein